MLKRKLEVIDEPNLLLMRPDKLIVAKLLKTPPFSLLKMPVHVCMPLFVNVPEFVTVVLFVNVPKFCICPVLDKVEPVAFVNEPPKSIFQVAPDKLSTVLLLVNSVGQENVPALLLIMPLFVAAPFCDQVAKLLNTPVVVFVKGEFELTLPLLLSVPELLKPPELVIVAPALMVKVP